VDVVYPVKAGPCAGDELRHSLRSLVNLPHDRVWVVGDRPRWLVGARHIPVPQASTKYLNSTTNVRTACLNPDVSDPFVLFNDDFFVLQPIDEVPVLHRGPVDVEEKRLIALRSGSYLRGLRDTRRVLATRGYTDLLSYELHVPLVVHKAAMLQALEMGSRVPVWHKRTAYGAVARLGGVESADVKIASRLDLPPADAVFVSTTDEAFRSGAVGRFLRAAFPNPSPYER
jgi:hypothetical protein